MRSMRRAAEMGREGGVVANVSGLVRSAPPCSTIDPEGEVGLKDDLDEVTSPDLTLTLTLTWWEGRVRPSTALSRWHRTASDGRA